MDKPQIVGHLQKSLNYTTFDCKWIPVSSKFVVVGSYPRNTGAIQIYDVTVEELKLITEVEKPKSFKCCTFGASQVAHSHLATGSFDGRLAIWDLKDDRISNNPLYSTQAHKEIINTIDGVGGIGIGEGAPELATGSRDGTVKVWDTRQAKLPVASMEAGSQEAQGDPTIVGGIRDCWTVAFGHAYNQHDRCLAAGYDNGDIKLFDLRAMRVRWETNVKNGVCCLEFDRKDIDMNKLVATTLESKLHVFDMRTQHPKLGFSSLTEKAHSSTVWQVRHLPQQRDLMMTTGGNGSLNLWKYEYPTKRRKLVKETQVVDGTEREVEVPQGVMGSLTQLQNITLSNQPISGFDWCAEKTGLAVCVAFDQTVRLLITTKLNRL